MIKVLIGDLIKSPLQAKVNTVNCVGIMGKGIALGFKKLYPEMFEDYAQRCRNGELRPGVPYLFTNLFGEKVINFPTKDHWKALSKLEYIIHGLDLFASQYKEWGISSVAFPPLGCGNGGLDWSMVGPIMYQKLSELDIDVEIYAPYNTPLEQLKPEFLLREVIPNFKAKLMDNTVPSGWIAILEILNRLEKMKYTNYVGRVVFQKICYVATYSGLQTNLDFKASNYGPFSAQVNDMYKVLGNANLISEEKNGSLLRIKTGEEYTLFRSKVINVIDNHENDINRIVDLFNRIKSTEQAEEVATILFAIEELCHNSVNEMTTEQEFYEYILKWKKHWNSDGKKQSIASAIRNLASMGWIRLDYSDELPFNEADIA